MPSLIWGALNSESAIGLLLSADLRLKEIGASLKPLVHPFQFLVGRCADRLETLLSLRPAWQADAGYRLWSALLSMSSDEKVRQECFQQLKSSPQFNEQLTGLSGLYRADPQNTQIVWSLFEHYRAHSSLGNALEHIADWLCNVT